MSYSSNNVLANPIGNNAKNEIIREFNIQANEMGILFFSGYVRTNGGVTVGNPVRIIVEESYNVGVSWSTVAAETVLTLSSSGNFTWKRDPDDNKKVAPYVRLKLYTDTTANFVLESLYKSDIDASDPVFNTVSLSAGAITAETGFTRDGASVGVVQDTVDPSNNVPLPTTLMDAATGEPLDLTGGVLATTGKLPNGANAVTMEYPDTETEVVRFRTGGASGAIVKSVTIVYTDSTKTTLASIVES